MPAISACMAPLSQRPRGSSSSCLLSVIQAPIKKAFYQPRCVGSVKGLMKGFGLPSGHRRLIAYMILQSYKYIEKFIAK
jgi:hypothetical protein